jgi:hypothetical protein
MSELRPLQPAATSHRAPPGRHRDRRSPRSGS